MRLVRSALAFILAALALAAVAREYTSTEYREVSTGFYATARLHGDTSGLLVSDRRTAESQYSAWVKVEEVP